MFYKGHSHSIKTRQKISESRKGKYIGIHNHFYGKNHSEESKLKMSKAKKGKKLSKEHVEKVLKARAGYIHTEETKKKISKSLKGNKNGFGNKGKKFTEQHKKNMSMAGKRKKFSLEHRQKLSKNSKELMKNEEFKKKIADANKKYWLNPESKEKLIKRNLKLLNSKPNKAEMKLLNILNILQPDEWRYVGNGQVIINGKCPDFININGKKTIIELFGDYWHKGQNPQDRINCFSPFGYNTLIIWEKELKDLNSLKTKINNFGGGYG